MDGVTMGGGVGISQPAKYRVATENTLFAMPEGSIGLFPDVGAGWYLPRLPGRIGQFLALTGARLDGAECLWSGLATHYLPSEHLAEAKAHIVEAPRDIDRALRSLAPLDPPPARLAQNAEKIDRLFASDRLEEILAALQADPSEWAAKELKAVTAKCPTTAKVALRQFAAGARMNDFADEMRTEYRLASRMMLRPDFAEGVRAVLVDKDNAPKWEPATPEDVSDPMLDAIFAPLGAGEEWTPFRPVA
jgi:enoyl-CoA hydratase